MIDQQINCGGVLFIGVVIILLMAERGIKKKIQRSYERYHSYDLKVWSLEFFDENTGGYVVVNRKRLARARKGSNEREKYETEFGIAEVYACNGYTIEMLEESTNACSYDVLIDGKPADFKKTKNAHNIYKYAKEAVRKQGAEIVLFQFEENTDEIQWELFWLKQKGYKAMYFFTKERKVHIL